MDYGRSLEVGNLPLRPPAMFAKAAAPAVRERVANARAVAGVR
jgi:hypothetical protein